MRLWPSASLSYRDFLYLNVARPCTLPVIFTNFLWNILTDMLINFWMLLNANRESYILHQIVSFVITFEFHFSHTLSKNLVKCQFAVDEDVTSNLADRETFAILTNYKPCDTCKVFSDSWASCFFPCLSVCTCNLIAGTDSCTTIKDSKHHLQDDGTRYLAVYYSGGPDIFIQ